MAALGAASVNAARLQAQGLGFSDVRAAVRFFVAQGLTNDAIGRRLGISNSAVRYHRRALSQPGADGLEYGYQPKYYREVIEGMCRAESVQVIALRLGTTVRVVRQYQERIAATGLFAGLDCEHCPQVAACKLRVACGRRAMCETVVKHGGTSGTDRALQLGGDDDGAFAGPHGSLRRP